MKIRIKSVNKILLLLFILFGVVSIASVVGAANISILNGIKIIASQIPIIDGLIDLSGIPDSHIFIILNIRLPRIILALLVGYGLSIVGVSFQGLLKNPMADPYVIGTSSGAALGAAIAILLKLNKTILGVGAVSIFAFIGALLATFIVYQLARVKSKVPVTTLLLAGIATGQFYTAIMSFIMVISSKDVTSIVFWTLGSFSSRGWNHVQIAILPIIIASIIIYIFSKDLNVLLLGEATAQNTGVNVEWVKRIILVTSAFITAFAVSVSGIIGFVGLIIPHIMRMLVGPDHRVLIPASGLMGGIFLIAADTLARTIIAPTEVPVGIITALSGGPFFIYLLRRTKKVI
ncbi:iron chelate uptake ABC transporter family permease subunit [Alkaliphilus pronyensis]|uniref:Iron chelate uptake ABC transporter family permease subunit n=1 Tax=Alkaliphilus pronyensis TaxID=1482732 RepID=A0A6I0EX45_9FIRM|nr:iron chelate uptake ABC transporter family permease subunit [Alkaliphilus pronyensis]KAB3532898.1 iron chelate uptake ABC transporter family permease subunit [Alkaliphilus pronyensis]